MVFSPRLNLNLSNCQSPVIITKLLHVNGDEHRFNLDIKIKKHLPSLRGPLDGSSSGVVEAGDREKAGRGEIRIKYEF